ncbi:MAG: hypothetical protein AAGC68_07865 [Verrucomicrobiota bacterium]
MNKSLPGNLNEIFPLKLRLREAFRYVEDGEAVLAERVRDNQRFSLRRWQHAMLLGFDGTRTFEEIARDAYARQGGGFTSVGLLNFYRWLYQEDLVSCECESVFELADDEEQIENDGIERPGFGGIQGLVELLRPNKEWQRQLIKLSAIVVFSLSVIRLGYVVAPIFEPEVDRALVGAGKILSADEQSATMTESSREAELVPPREMELAGRVDPVTPASSSGEPNPATLEGSTEETKLLRRPPVGESLDRLEQLRRAMEECRVRRDEFYIQNDEAGYRREVQTMNRLAQEIGELESAL